MINDDGREQETAFHTEIKKLIDLLFIKPLVVQLKGK